MPTDSPDTPDDPVVAFEYYVLRLSRASHRADRLAGQLERLGTGEKRRFDSAEQLVRLVAGWSEISPGEGTGP